MGVGLTGEGKGKGGLNLSAGFDFLMDKHLITAQLFSIR